MNMKKRVYGFTLIEMSMVLVVIGIIISGVSIGVNMQRSAEYARIKTTFVDGWVQAYNEYYNRTGVVIGDNPAEPTLMVAGNDYAYTYAAGAGTGMPGVVGDTGGIIGTAAIYKICEGQGASDYGTETTALTAADGAGTLTLSGQRVHELMDRHGIRMPAGRAEGQEDRYSYLDNNGNPQELQVCFQWNPANTTHGSGNSMIIRGLTPDLARRLDALVDGSGDAREGRFRQYYPSASNDSATDQTPSREWTGVNSVDQADGNGVSMADINDTAFATRSTAAGPPLAPGDFNSDGYGASGPAGAIQDEDLVMKVTAVYLMDM